MQDYVRCAVQIEPELVGGELVAGHPVGLEAVLEFRYHLLHASPVAVSSQFADILLSFTFPASPVMKWMPS